MHQLQKAQKANPIKQIIGLLLRNLEISYPNGYVDIYIVDSGVSPKRSLN